MNSLQLFLPGRARPHVAWCVALALSLAVPVAAQDQAGDDFDPTEMGNPEDGLVGAPEPAEPAEAPEEESAFAMGREAYDTDAVQDDSPDSGDDRGGALLLTGKVGGGLPLSGLDPNVAGALEVGYLFSRDGVSLGALLDVSYFVPQAEGTASDARLGGSDDGSYGWHAWQKELTFQPTFLVRLAMLSEAVVPYAGIGPRLYLLQTVIDGKAGDASFPITKERSMKFGVGLPLGAEITLGPGALIGELLFQWGPLDHEITGDPHLASATLWLGYRALL